MSGLLRQCTSYFLAAIRDTASPEDHDTMNLIDSALIAHAQLTRGIGATMSSAMLASRQIWLAQTSLLENRKDIANMSVVPGRVFHPDCQSIWDKAEKSCRTMECIQRTFSNQVVPGIGPGALSLHTRLHGLGV